MTGAVCARGARRSAVAGPSEGHGDFSSEYLPWPPPPPSRPAEEASLTRPTTPDRPPRMRLGGGCHFGERRTLRDRRRRKLWHGRRRGGRRQRRLGRQRGRDALGCQRGRGGRGRKRRRGGHRWREGQQLRPRGRLLPERMVWSAATELLFVRCRRLRLHETGAARRGHGVLRPRPRHSLQPGGSGHGKPSPGAVPDGDHHVLRSASGHGAYRGHGIQRRGGVLL